MSWLRGSTEESPLCPRYHSAMAPPVLVTGSHRSGTTWVGKMLSRPPGVAYVHEPFNPQRAPGWIGGRLPHWYLYVCPENEEPYLPLMRRVLALRYPLRRDLARAGSARQLGQVGLEWARAIAGRASRSRLLMKDPIALFSAEWLADRFGFQVVVMVRHPAAFAGSLKRLEWAFDFANWAEQPLLLRDHLGPFQDRIRASAARQPDIVDQAILLWNGIHRTIDSYRERRPAWTFVKYEELADAPVKGFRDLYRRLGLPWGEEIRKAVERHSSERNLKEVPRLLHRRVRRDSRAAARTWRTRLTEEERDRVRAGTAEVASRFYSDADWVAAP
jgi:hypothetical protein